MWLSILGFFFEVISLKSSDSPNLTHQPRHSYISGVLHCWAIESRFVTLQSGARAGTKTGVTGHGHPWTLVKVCLVWRRSGQWWTTMDRWCSYRSFGESFRWSSNPHLFAFHTMLRLKAVKYRFSSPIPNRSHVRYFWSFINPIFWMFHSPLTWFIWFNFMMFS